MDKVTLADLQMKYGTALDKRLVNDVMPVAPLVKWLPSEVISGTSMQYRCVTSIPKVGPRPVNAGVDAIRANYELKRSQLFLYQGLIAIDVALAKADPSGEGGLMAEQAELVMQGAMFTLEQYAIYGKALGEDAMPGILDGIGNYMTISADAAHNTTETRQDGGASVLAIVGDPKMLRLQFGNSLLTTLSDFLQPIPNLTQCIVAARQQLLLRIQCVTRIDKKRTTLFDTNEKRRLKQILGHAVHIIQLVQTQRLRLHALN